MYTGCHAPRGYHHLNAVTTTEGGWEQRELAFLTSNRAPTGSQDLGDACFR